MVSFQNDKMLKKLNNKTNSINCKNKLTEKMKRLI